MSTAELDIRIRAGDVPNATRELQRLERQGANTERGLGGLTDASGAASASIGRLAGAVSGLSAVMAASTVIKYADAWTTVSNKLVNSVKDHESLAQVQERVFAIAQESRSSLEATATLYGRLSSATAEYIKEGETIGGMVETIAKAMSVSGATTAEMEGSLVQLSQAFGAGALRGEEFNSVNEAAPRLMQALADSLGVARGQLKSMAAEGQLTTEVLYNAWNGQSKAAAQIQSEFEKMSVTAGAKIAQAQNNLTKWIGENQTAISVTKNYGDAAVVLSNNLDTLADAGTALAAVMGARLAGGLAQAATAKVSAAAASRALAVAELNGAKAATTAASAEVALLQAQVATWTQRIKGAATENQASRFRERLAADTALLTGAENSLTAATSRLSAAQAGAAVTGKAMSGAMALLGGPVGVAVLAASAIFAFSSRANEAADPTRQLNDRVRQLTSSMKELSVAEVDKTIGDIERQMVLLNNRMNLAESMDDKLGIKEETKGKIQAELDSMTAMYRKMMEQRKKIMSGGTDQPEDVKFAAISDPKDDKKAKKAEDAAKRAYDAKIAALAKEQQAEADDYQKRLAAAGEFNARMEALNASELDKARNERGQRMIENQAAYNNGLISEEQYQLNLSAIKQRYEADRTAIQKQELEKQRQLASDSANILIQQTQFMTGTVADMLRDSGKENSGLMQGMLAAQKALAIPSIIVSTEQAAAAAMAHESLLGGLLSGTMAANIIRAQGAISAGIVAGQAIGGFAGMFDNGGSIGSGQWGIVGENGPEIVKGPASVTSRKKTAAMAASAMSGDSGGNMYVTINQTIQGNGDETMAKMVSQATENTMNQVQRDFAGNGRLRKTLGV